jgi:Protein of unknown function (DUF2490)
LYSWHSFETPVNFSKRWQLVLHHRERTRHEFSYLDQARAGGVLRWSATKHLTPYVGYYFQPQQLRSDEWIQGHRIFAGVEAPFQIGPGARLTTRIAMERFIHTGRPNYSRYRSSARVVFGRRRVAPYLQNEWLAVNQGFHSVRNSGGLRLRVSAAVVVEGGYLYDIRRSLWGGDRQAIVTGVRFEPKAR